MNNRMAPRLWALALILAFVAQVLIFGAGPLQAAPGERDTSFGDPSPNDLSVRTGLTRTHLGGNEHGRAVVALPDGKLIVAGIANEHAGNDFLLLRYLADGRLDATFGTAGKVVTDLGGTDDARALLLRTNGNLVAVGTSCVADNCDMALVGYRPDGSSDPAFGAVGAGGVVKVDLGLPWDEANAAALQPDGKIVVAGRRGFVPADGSDPPISPTADDDLAVVRFTAAGALDDSFGFSDSSSDQHGVVVVNFGGEHDWAEDVTVQPDGKIVVVGTTANYSANGGDGPRTENVALARFGPDGSPDPSFGGAGRVATVTHRDGYYGKAVAVQPDGKLLVVAEAISRKSPVESTMWDFLVSRYTENGVLDPSFGTGGSVGTDFTPSGNRHPSDDHPKAIVLQPDGKFIVLGTTQPRGSHGSLENDGFAFVLARYGPDGVLDSSFGTNGIVIGQEALPEAGELVQRSNGRLVHTGSLRTQGKGTTFDVIVARYLGDPIPVIESVEGGAQSPVRANDASPKIVAAGLTPGHTLKVYDGTTEVASKPISGETMTLNATEADTEVVLSGEGEHVLSVRGRAPGGQLSAVTPGFVYVLDSKMASPSLAIDDVQVVEADSGTTEAVFTVTRTSASGANDQQVVVDFTTFDATATAPNDYQHLSGSLSMLPGESTKTISIRVVGETAPEGHEHFGVRLSDPDNATIAKAEGTAVIVDNDNPEPVVRAVSPSAGPTTGGTAVKITGLALNDATKVEFGTTVATTLTVVSDTELQVVSPAHRQGRVDVRVTTPLGTSDTFFEPTFTFGAGAWTETGSMALGRGHHSATSLDGPACRGASPPEHCGKVLVVGVDNILYDFPHRPSFPVQNQKPPPVGAELYDPAKGTFSVTSSPQMPRYAHTATLLDGPECHGGNPPSYCGKVLIAGGQLASEDTFFTLAELYDPAAATWTPAGMMNHVRSFHTATLLEGPGCGAHCGKVLVASGNFSYEEPSTNGSAELYDPRNNTWEVTGYLDECSPTTKCRARARHTATLLPSGKVLVVGGGGLSSTNKVEVLSSAQIYDPASGTWQALGEHAAVSRFSHTATLIEGAACEGPVPAPTCGKVLIAGGITGMSGPGHDFPVFTDDTTLFDPQTHTWAPGALMNTPRGGHSASVLDDGTILVAGRDTTVRKTMGDPTPTAEIYEPRSGAWLETADMHRPRGGHTATVLDGPKCRSNSTPSPSWCGSVMVAGGWLPAFHNSTVENDPVIKNAEVYTPAPRVSSILPAIGRALGGTEVIIHGSGFTDEVSAVSFDGTPATSFSVEPGRRIKAVSPAHAPGPADVAVVNKSGTSAAMVPDRAARFVYAGAPGAITDLVATPSAGSALLSFTSPDDGTTLAPAIRYVVKQSRSPIEGDDGFAAARTLCGGECSVEAGQTVAITVADLDPETTYYYAVQALNPLGEPGPIARVSTTTTSTEAPPAKAATSCGPSPSVGAGQIAYPGGHYSLVGLPPASVLGTSAPLYSWIDQGAGGSYTSLPGSTQLQAGHGYWAWFACDGLATLGAGQSSATMALGAYHASMVGNPSATSPAVVSGHDFAARWDPNANAGAGGYAISGYREPQGLALGEAIWVFSYVPSTVAINASS